MVRENRAQLCKYSARQLSRVYPAAAAPRASARLVEPAAVGGGVRGVGERVPDGRANFNGGDFNHDLFRLNAGCSYVLKPKLSPHVGLGLGEKGTWRRTSGRRGGRRRRRASRRS